MEEPRCKTTGSPINPLIKRSHLNACLKKYPNLSQESKAEIAKQFFIVEDEDDGIISSEARVGSVEGFEGGGQAGQP